MMISVVNAHSFEELNIGRQKSGDYTIKHFASADIDYTNPRSHWDSPSPLLPWFDRLWKEVRNIVAGLEPEQEVCFEIHRTAAGRWDWLHCVSGSAVTEDGTSLNPPLTFTTTNNRLANLAE
jgi:hypothetical protein